MSNPTEFQTYTSLAHENDEKINLLAESSNRILGIADSISVEIQEGDKVIANIDENTPLVRNKVHKAHRRMNGIILNAETRSNCRIIFMLCVVLIFVIFMAIVF
ncbi:t-SNARE coiled-coil-like proteiny domain-containing protein [Entamoeba marina]